MRDWEIQVEEADGELVERDTRSGVVTTWTVLPAPDRRTVVRVTLSWESPAGFAGMRERSRAGKLRRVYGEVLHGLRTRLTPTG